MIDVPMQIGMVPSPQNVLETFLLSYLSANCGCCRSSKRRVDVPDVVVDDRDGVSLFLSRLRKHKCGLRVKLLKLFTDRV